MISCLDHGRHRNGRRERPWQIIAEWLKQIPDVRLDPARPAITRGGVIIGMPQLGLLWDV